MHITLFLTFFLIVLGSIYVVSLVFLLYFYRRSKRNEFSQSTFEAIWAIERIVLDTVDFEEAAFKVVNTILTQLGYLKLGYEVIVLTLLDEKTQELKRIAISRTKSADRFLQATPVPFQSINIPLDAKDNLCVRAIYDKKKYTTKNVSDVLYPAISRAWVSQFQSVLGIKTSIVYPILSGNNPLGALILSLSKDESKIKKEEWTILDSFVGSVGIALDHAILFKSLNVATEKLTVANNRLQLLDKLKDDFVSVASHELRTPMTAIKSYLWMALNKRKDELTPDLLRYLDRAYVSVDRLINLVSDMLNVSRIESGRISLELASVNLIELAKEVAEEVGAKATERKVSVSVNQSNQAPQVLCDKNKVHEVLLNLIGNSLKFTPEGGTITVKFAVQDQMLETAVVDTGRGISAEDLPKLFSKFGRLDNSYVAMAESSGTGLGLYIAKSIVEMHKGAIKGSSEGLDKGSTFSFTLPIVNTEVAKVLAAEVPRDTANAKQLEHTAITL